MLLEQRIRAYYQRWCRLFAVLNKTTEVTRVRRRLLWALMVAGVLALTSAAPAFAYYESSQTSGPAGTPAWSCQACHGREDGRDLAHGRSPSGTRVRGGASVGTRKGPQGGYTTGTNKCELCHVVHTVPEATASSFCARKPCSGSATPVTTAPAAAASTA